MPTMKLEIVTTEEIVFTGNVDYVSGQYTATAL